MARPCGCWLGSGSASWGFSLAGPELDPRAQSRLKHALDMDTGSVTAAERRIMKWEEKAALSEKMRKAYIDKVTWKPGRKST